MLGGLQPHQLRVPWGAGGRRREAWRCGKGPAVARCSVCPEGLNLPSISVGQDPFWAAVDASRFSWHRAAAEKQKHMAEGWDVATNTSLKEYKLLAGSLL